VTRHKNRHDKVWYLIFSRPGQETVARQQLERQGYTTYLPMVLNARRRNGRRRYVREPLFPRYLFIRLDQVTDNWAPIRSTIGVSTLVRFGMEPAPVSDSLIAAIRARENSDGLHEIRSELSEGSTVRVLDGPMMGLEGIFLSRSGEQRAMVLLELMGKLARVQLDVDAIEAING